MGGQGAAADPQGVLYIMTGNGDFDGAGQWGESFLKLQYTPASRNNGGHAEGGRSLDPVDRLARTGQQVSSTTPRIAGVSAASEALRQPTSGRHEHSH